jgi:hypothetical protein
MVMKSRSMGGAEHVARMGEMRNAYKRLVGRPERKRTLGRHRSRWEYSIRMYLRGIGWRVWTGSIWHRIGTSGGQL